MSTASLDIRYFAIDVFTPLSCHCFLRHYATTPLPAAPQARAVGFMIRAGCLGIMLESRDALRRCLPPLAFSAGMPPLAAVDAAAIPRT